MAKNEMALRPVSVTIAPLVNDGAETDPEAIPEGIVTVPLTGKQGEGKTATLLLSDFAHLLQEHGCFLSWIADSNETPEGAERFYVRAYSKRRKDVVQVAWLFLDIWRGQGKRVKYLDGNPLNLVRTNLQVIGTT